jgi:hypothetical protein
VKQSPLVEAWEVVEPPCYKSLCSNAELVVKQSAASKDVNMAAEEAMSLEAFTGQPVKIQQTEKT